MEQHGVPLGERCQIMCARVSTIQSRQESGWSGQSKSQFHQSDFGALRIGNGKSRFPVIDRNAEFQCAKSHHRTPNKQHYKSLLKCCGFCGSVRLDMERKYLQRKRIRNRAAGKYSSCSGWSRTTSTYRGGWNYQRQNRRSKNSG